MNRPILLNLEDFETLKLSDKVINDEWINDYDLVNQNLIQKAVLIKKLLNQKGFCLIQLDTSVSDFEILQYYSVFLKNVGKPIRVFDKKEIWRKIGVIIDKDPESSEGIGKSPIHIDFVNSTSPPGIVGLVCIKKDPKGGGTSIISNYRKVLKDIPQEYLLELAKPIYTNGKFYNLINIGKEYKPFPIYKKNDDFLRYTEKLNELNLPVKTKKALKYFSEILAKNSIKIHLEKHQLLLLNQQIVLHGKTPLGKNQKEVEKSKRRELQQIFISMNLENETTHFRNIYNFLNKKFETANNDFMLVLGSTDLNVAKFAGKYFLKNPTKYVIVSGGFGKVTKDIWDVSEAKKFSKIMIDMGVPKDVIYLDEKATNTGENILNAKKIVIQNNLKHEKGLIVTKPYMTRRAYNTASKQWSDVKWSVIAEEMDFEDYLKSQEDIEKFKNIMIGDIQRIKLYGEKGFQIEDRIPKDVWQSYVYLSKQGYNQFVIK